MRSSFAGFTTAQLAMRASQKALDVTGQNIANINTKGYTRQRLDLISFSTGRGVSKYESSLNVKVGSGVLTTGLSQIRDPFLDIRYRNEVANAGTQDQKLAIMKDLETVFDEVTKNGIQNQISDISTMLQKLSSEVGNSEFDSMVKSSSDVLTKMFNQYAKQLDSIKAEHETNLDIDIGTINDLLSNIHKLNETIKINHIHGNSALELQDQRNSLIDELSGYMKIDVKYKIEQITDQVSVEVPVISLVGETGKIPLIDGNYKTELSVKKTSGGKINIKMTMPDATSLEITEEITEGTLKGTLDMLNKSGEFDSYKKNLDVEIQTVNSLLSSIKKLNENIKTEHLSGKPVLELEKQRNLLMEELDGYISIDVKYKNVQLTDDISIKEPVISFVGNTGNAVLLDGDFKTELSIKKTAGLKTNIMMTMPEILQPSDPPVKVKQDPINITDEIKSGTIKGILDMYKLSGDMDSANINLDVEISTINGIIGNIHQLNQTIKTEYMNGNSVEELDKQRKALIEDLDGYMSVDVKYITVQLAEDTFIQEPVISLIGEFENTPLIYGNFKTELMKVSAEDSADGKTNIKMTMPDIIQPSEPPVIVKQDPKKITEDITAGTIKGILDIFNKSGELEAGSGEARGIGYYEKSLDLLAYKFAESFNKANGVGKELFAPSKQGETITAKNISISEGWNNGSIGITASVKPGSPMGSNDNILNMISMLTEKMEYKVKVINKDGIESEKSLFTGSFQEMFTNTGSMLALDVKSTTSLLENHVTIADEIANMRDNVSSVSLDEEGMNILHYQKSYNAAARLMTALDEALNTIINSMGIVGR